MAPGSDRAGPAPPGGDGGAAPLLAEVDAGLAWLEGVVAGRLPWPPTLDPVAARVGAVLDGLLRLRDLDATAALARLDALDTAVGDIAVCCLSSPEPDGWIDALHRHAPGFLHALAADGAAPDVLADRLWWTLTQVTIAQPALPPELLRALGRQEREGLVLRLAAHQATAAVWRDKAVPVGWATALVLAEEDTAHLVRFVREHGLEELVPPAVLAERLACEGRADLQPLLWLDLALVEGSDDEELAGQDALTLRCVAHLEAAGLPGLAGEARWLLFARRLRPDLLRAWLDGQPGAERAAAEARAVAHVMADERRGMALLFLLDWPDLGRVAELVCLHHADPKLLHANDRDLLRAMTALEGAAPDAARLLAAALGRAAAVEAAWRDLLLEELP